MLARPALLPRLAGVDAATAARVSWLGVMVGAREVALGIGTLDGLRGGGDARAWLVAGALSDVGDAAAFGRATARGQVAPALGALAAVTALGSAATQLLSLRAGGRAARRSSSPRP